MYSQLQIAIDYFLNQNVSRMYLKNDFNFEKQHIIYVIGTCQSLAKTKRDHHTSSGGGGGLTYGHAFSFTWSY